MKPPTTTSEAENDDQLQDETRVSFGSLKSHDSTTTAKKDSINEVSSSSRSRTSNKSVHEEPGDVALHHNDQPPETTTDQLSETEHSTSDVSNISNTVSEEIEEEYEIELKSFFEHLREKIFGWEILKTDTEVVMVFKQGHSYQGKLVNCRMHGHGKFYWADGSVYVGDFYNGEMSGDGYMQWADLSWYEGQMQQGYRHGLGLFVQSVGFYTGSWQCGRRHGLGAMYYNRNNTSRDYYNGEWARDCKHGTGLRCYPSGAMYSGQWKGGVRHGLGTMVWTNNDKKINNYRELEEMDLEMSLTLAAEVGNALLLENTEFKQDINRLLNQITELNNQKISLQQKLNDFKQENQHTNMTLKAGSYAAKKK
ncbi:hypothetical protein J6590_059047 [Homalodisca vitripennis]|nr:hypothetical protein J6590_059047 [Homalodisca vitripennis]